MGSYSNYSARKKNIYSKKANKRRWHFSIWEETTIKRDWSRAISFLLFVIFIISVTYTLHPLVFSYTKTFTLPLPHILLFSLTLSAFFGANIFHMMKPLPKYAYMGSNWAKESFEMKTQVLQWVICN